MFRSITPFQTSDMMAGVDFFDDLPGYSDTEESHQPRTVCNARSVGPHRSGGLSVYRPAQTQGSSMGLQLRLENRPLLTQVLEPRMTDGFYEAVDFWTHNTDHRTAEFTSNGQTHQVPFTFAPDEWIESMVPGEKYGFYFGDMMFLNASLLEQHPEWVPFVVVKLYGERFVDEGLDPAGRQKHYEALFRTICLARQIMATPQLDEFLRNLMLHERDGFSDWDASAERFLAGHANSLEAKRAYLEAHHGNKWVRQGQHWEDMERVMPGLTGGFRNRAQALFDQIVGAEAVYLYSAAVLVTLLVHQPQDGELRPLLIRPPFNSIAYALTKESNGVADLVRFHDVTGLQRGEDVITMGKGFSRITLIALGKRLSRRISQLELKVRALAAKRSAEIERIILETAQLNDSTALQIADLRAAPTTDETALARFAALQKEYPVAAAKLAAEAQRTAENLSALTELASLLKAAI